MRNVTIITIIIGTLVIAGIWYGTDTAEPKKMSAADAARMETTIASYDDCVAAGYPVMESLPEQCATNDGRTFTNTDSPLPAENGIAVGEPYGASAPQSDDASAAVAAAKAQAAIELGTTVRSIGLLTITKGDWPDGCLGLPKEDEMCTMMIVPGFNITFIADEQLLTYRTDHAGTVVRRDLE